MKLTGPELKAKITALGQIDESTAAEECGYVSADGKPKIAAFRAAVLEANGVAFTKPARAKGAGKPLSYMVTAGKTNGNIVLAGGYSTLIGIKPGEKIQVEHETDTNCLVLSAVEN